MKIFKISNIVSLLGRIFISTVLKVTNKWNSMIRKTSLPPGPKPCPIIGSLSQMLLNKKPTYHWIHKIMEEMDTEIACICVDTFHVIPVTSPELVREFLHIQDSIFSSRPICMSANLISNGCLTSVFLPIGDQWTKMRRIFTSHVLSPTSLQWLHHKRDEEANHLHRFIYNQCKNQGVINLRKMIRRYSGNVIRSMIFSKRLCEIIGEDEQVDAVLRFLNIFMLLKIIKKAYVTTTKHIDAEVDQRIHIWKDDNKSLEEDILDVLIMLKYFNGNPLMNVKEIKAQVLVIEWALAEKLNQPKLMQWAVEELHTVVGMNRLVQESDLPRLNNVKACIKLHPISPFNVPHVSIFDTIVGEKYFIPKRSVVLLSRLGLGCPGVKLGSTITTMLLAMLLHGFSWSLPPNSPSNDLSESSKTDHFGILPLLALAKPRLSKDMHP
ncbi:hypothetical protein R3W88_019266 [Solanum pinnatisectum]|uniref:Cytochrome P450 n=1 Tax=Solanum pinnatisectum TaxID=50273 RepID=A0AAV9KLC9_9SOLN|nr:hypothetical protein R3W88_019266 [Solanum pinnatisectum]